MESLKYTINYPGLQEKTFVVFFTRLSQFRKSILGAISKTSWEKYWPDYIGAPADIVAAQIFFEQKIRDSTQNPSVRIHVHFINTTDADTLDKFKAPVDEVIAYCKPDAVNKARLVAGEKAI
jgi:hypothetical protein